MGSQTVALGLSPEAMNGGNLVDVFQQREDDFEATNTLEVSYVLPSGEKAQELVFCESKGRGPRILVPESCSNCRDGEHQGLVRGFGGQMNLNEHNISEQFSMNFQACKLISAFKQVW